MIEITQEMLDKIHTDSDVRDLAEELGTSYRKLEFAISNKDAEGTPCHNCKHLCMSNMYPCSQCARKHKIDFYESILESEVE
jgi:hypothetical protein